MKSSSVLMKIPIVLMIGISVLLVLLVILEMGYLVVTVPMLILGWSGWFIGQRLEKKYSAKKWLVWVSLLIGLVGFFIGLVAGVALSFQFLPCGVIGC